MFVSAGLYCYWNSLVKYLLGTACSKLTVVVMHECFHAHCFEFCMWFCGDECSLLTLWQSPFRAVLVQVCLSTVL
jgi:hypothetical protein